MSFQNGTHLYVGDLLYLWLCRGESKWGIVASWGRYFVQEINSSQKPSLMSGPDQAPPLQTKITCWSDLCLYHCKVHVPTELWASRENSIYVCLAHYQSPSLKHRTWQRVSVLQILIKLLNNLGREKRLIWQQEGSGIRGHSGNWMDRCGEWLLVPHVWTSDAVELIGIRIFVLCINFRQTSSSPGNSFWVE